MKVVGQLSYVKQRQIGAGYGQNSQVFEVFDSQLGGIVAAKEIPKQSFGNSLANYYAEAQVMFAVEHPNIVPVKYACDAGAHVSLVMPLFTKGSLAERIKNGPLSVIEGLAIAQDLLSGLVRVHTKGFVHLDIKPSNVFFDSDGHALVADFGQARTLSSTGVATNVRLYTPLFPPETIHTDVATVASDVYQVGVLLYRAVNGNPFYKSQLPPAGTDLKAVLWPKIRAGTFPDRRRFMPHVPKRLKTVLRRAMEVVPGARYASATELADALTKVQMPHDWQVTALPNGTRWLANRDKDGKAPLEITATQSGSGLSCVEARTLGGKARAWGSSWVKKDGLSAAGLDRHLREVFARLAE